MRRALLVMPALAGCIDAPSSADQQDDVGTEGTPDAGAQLLVNPGFEEGVGVGSIFQPGGAPRIGTGDELEVVPQGGDYVAEVGDSDNTNEVISQVVDVPEGAASLTLSFHRCVFTEEPMEIGKAYDYCNVRSNVDGQPYTLLQESNLDATESCDWLAASVAVTPFTAGAPIELSLVANNDDSASTRCLYDSFVLVPD